MCCYGHHLDQGDTAKKTSQAIDEMKAITGDMGYYVGMAVQNKSPDGKCGERDEPHSYGCRHYDICSAVHQYHRLVGTIPFSAGYGVWLFC